MGPIEGASRVQPMLLPEALDDSMTQENPARFIDAFVDSLDLDALSFRHTQTAATGRPSYAPRDVRKLYPYGSMHRIRASRRLEQETHRNVERLWLLWKLRPDFKTIVDFRQDSANAFKQVFRACVRLCNEWGLCGQALVAIDGSQCKAVDSQRRHLTPAKLNETLKRLDAHIEPYLHDWDTADAEEADTQKPTSETRQEKIRQLRERQGRDEGLRHEMESSGQSQVSLTDPDSRAMPKSPNVDVGDNAHVAVDAKPQLCVVQEVTHAVTDMDQLSGIALQAHKALEVVSRSKPWRIGVTIMARQSTPVKRLALHPLWPSRGRLPIAHEGAMGQSRAPMILSTIGTDAPPDRR